MRRATNRRLGTLLVAAVSALAVAITAGLLALDQRGDARDTALRADAQRLGAQALAEERLEHALRIARVGVELEESAATRSSLLSVLAAQPGAARRAARHRPGSAVRVGRSPDERLVAVGSDRGTVTVFDAAARRPLGAALPRA